jgi:hypothetical protein
MRSRISNFDSNVAMARPFVLAPTILSEQPYAPGINNYKILTHTIKSLTNKIASSPSAARSPTLKETSGTFSSM